MKALLPVRVEDGLGLDAGPRGLGGYGLELHEGGSFGGGFLRLAVFCVGACEREVNLGRVGFEGAGLIEFGDGGFGVSGFKPGAA